MEYRPTVTSLQVCSKCSTAFVCSYYDARGRVLVSRQSCRWAYYRTYWCDSWKTVVCRISLRIT